MDKIFKDSEEATNFIVNLNKTFFLDSKDYIKKYYKIRKIHSAVIDSMMNYIDSGKYPVDKYYNSILPNVRRETKNLMIFVDNATYDGAVMDIESNVKGLEYTVEEKIIICKFENLTFNDKLDIIRELFIRCDNETYFNKKITMVSFDSKLNGFDIANNILKFKESDNY